MKPDISVVKIGRQRKFRPIPPGALERTIIRHGLVGKIGSNWIGCARNGTQIHAKVGIRIGFVRHQGGHDCAGYLRGVPSDWLERRRRNLLALFRGFARRLQRPALLQSYFFRRAKLFLLQPMAWKRSYQKK